MGDTWWELLHYAASCDTRLIYLNLYHTWVNQTELPNYIVTTKELANSTKFGPFMISHQIETSNEGDGVCMISNLYGAICLLQNAADDDMDTYRIAKTDWETIMAGSPADNEALSVAVRASSGALMDKTTLNGSGEPDYVDWMDSYFCTQKSTG